MKINLKKNLSSFLVLFALFFGSERGNAESLEILTIEIAIEQALLNNPGLAKSTQIYEAAKTRPDQIGALPDPILTLGAMNFPTDTFERDQEPMTQLQIGIKQSFPFPGKRGLKEESAIYMSEIAKLSVEDRKLALTHMVATSWWEIFYLDKALETVEKNKVLLRQLIKVAETKYKTGQGLQQDVLLSHLEMSKVLEKELSLKAMRKQQVSMMNSLLNQSPNTPIKLPGEVSEKLPDIFSEDQLYAFAKAHSPLIGKAETMVSQSESGLALAKKGYLPDFTVGVTYGDRDGDNPMPMGGERTDFVSLMLGVKVPLYAGSKQGKQVEEKSVEAQQALFARQDVQNNLFREITAEYANYFQLKEQLSLFRNGIIPQSKQTTDSMMAGYQVSQVDFLNLVRSQLSLLNYELLYWKTLASSHKSLSKLQSLVGKEGIYE